MTRNIKFFIIVSVMLNVVLGGLVIGHASHRFGHAMPQAMSSLPPEKQAEFRDAMKKVHGEEGSGWKDVRTSREKIAGILTAPAFDKAAYMAEVEKMQAQRSKKWKQMANAIAGLAEHWSQQERKALAEMLQRQQHGRWHKDRGQKE